jgi:hypothetical protein
MRSIFFFIIIRILVYNSHALRVNYRRHHSLLIKLIFLLIIEIYFNLDMPNLNQVLVVAAACIWGRVAGQLAHILMQGSR